MIKMLRLLEYASPCFVNSKVLESPSLPRRRWHNIVASTGTVRSLRFEAETQTEENWLCVCDLFKRLCFFVRNCAKLRQVSLMLGY